MGARKMQQQGAISKSVGLQSQKGHDKVKAKEETEIIQLIVFDLGNEEFGATIDQVREILRVGPITPIPGSPDYIKGVANVRGEITVLMDLKARFLLSNKKEIESKHMIVTEQENIPFGLMVDEVTEVLRIPETDIKPAPKPVTGKGRAYIKGILTLKDRLIILLNLKKVLSEQELTRLTEIARMQSAAAEKDKEKTEEETLKHAEKKQQRTEQMAAEQTKKRKTGKGENLI
jgi:purine-binding chemotaxis protein CheW